MTASPHLSDGLFDSRDGNSPATLPPQLYLEWLPDGCLISIDFQTAKHAALSKMPVNEKFIFSTTSPQPQKRDCRVALPFARLHAVNGRNEFSRKLRDGLKIGLSVLWARRLGSPRACQHGKDFQNRSVRHLLLMALIAAGVPVGSHFYRKALAASMNFLFFNKYLNEGSLKGSGRCSPGIMLFLYSPAVFKF